MKPSYPKYKRGELETIKQGLSHKNRAELDSFAIHLLKSNKQPKVDKIFRILLQFYDVTGISLYTKPTIEQRDKFLALLNNSEYKASYKREVKVYIKKWLKWKWKDLDLIDGFPKLNENCSDKVTESSLLEEGEFKAMLSAEKSINWQALLSILYETGCRPDELLNLLWKDVNFLDDGITDLTFYTKKKSSVKNRIYPVKASTPYLKEWLSMNPDYKKDDLVFTSSHGNNPISTAGLNFHLKELAKKCKINKNVFPYLFRFMKASELYSGKNKLDDRVVANLLGHSPAMASRYQKISNKTAREMLISEIYKAKQLTKEGKHKLELEIEKLTKRIEAINRDTEELKQSNEERKKMEQHPDYKKLQEMFYKIYNKTIKK